MADSIKEIDHYYFGSPDGTLSKTFLPIISSFSSFPFIKITQGLSIYFEGYKVKKFNLKYYHVFVFPGTSFTDETDFSIAIS